MSNIGTRKRFIQWLSRVKSMTYTKYVKLGVLEKAAIQKEYTGR